MTILVPCLVIAVMIAVNALYVAAEFSTVATQKSQLAPLAKEGNGRAAGVMRVLEDGAQLDRYIAACQIGITLTSLIVGAYGQATIARELGPWLEKTFGLGATAAGSVAFLSVLLSLTIFQVVLGELVPKFFALQFPVRTALLTYRPTRWSVSIFRWLIWLLNGSGFLLLRPFGIRPGGQQHVHSPEELQILFAESRRGGALSPDAYRRLERGLRLSKRSVRQMMTPRSELYAIEISSPAAEVREKILASPYSRVPVYEGSLDNVIGAVDTKALAGWFAIRDEAPPLSRMLRHIPFVPETLGALRVVRTLQERQSSKALVVDEYGVVVGIISIEDVLSHLFGDIADELKQAEPGPERLPSGAVRLPGDMPLDEAEAWLGVRWEGPASTVGGHLVAHLGRWPTVGERVRIDDVELRVVEMSPTTVRWVIARPKASADGEAEGEGAPPTEGR